MANRWNEVGRVIRSRMDLHALRQLGSATTIAYTKGARIEAVPVTAGITGRVPETATHCLERTLAICRDDRLGELDP